MHHRTRLTLAVLAVGCIAGTALAQGTPAPAGASTGTAAPATPAATGTATAPAGASGDAAAVTRATCKRPEFPGKMASDNQKRTFNKDIEGYAECIKAFVADQQKQADNHIKAANQAALDYNNTVKELQSEIDAAKE